MAGWSDGGIEGAGEERGLAGDDEGSGATSALAASGTESGSFGSAETWTVATVAPSVSSRDGESEELGTMPSPLLPSLVTRESIDDPIVPLPAWGRWR